MTQEFVTLPREVVEQALEAWVRGCPPDCKDGMTDSGGVQPWGEAALIECPSCQAVEALRAALEQPQAVTNCHQLEQPQVEQEPYAWHYKNNGGASVWHMGPSNRLDADIEAAKSYPKVHQVTPLYLHPQPKREPLSKDRIREILMCNGFTIKDGEPDLKPYVYNAVQAILDAALQQPVVDHPQANQPAMTPIAQRKLDSLLTEGYTISGYSVYHERKHQHGFVTGAGLVGWWKPEGVEYPQAQVEREPVAFCHVGDVVVCDNDSLLRRLGVKRSDKLYLHPQDLNCKSKQALLATLWGYTKEQPKRPPLTDEQIDAIADAMPGGLDGFLRGWGWRQFARAVLAATRNIK